MKFSLSEHDIYTMIRREHCPPEWACFYQVGNSTGSGYRRCADAIAMNLWPSRGLEIRGFEIKVTRQDLQKELDTPEKAETIARYCNTWWLATPDGLVKDLDELPPGWGLMVVREDKLVKVKKATYREDAVSPSAGFLAELVKAAHAEMDAMRTSMVPLSSINDRLRAEFERGAVTGPSHLKLRVQELENKVAGARAVLKEIGVDIDDDPEGWRCRFNESTGTEIARHIRLGKAVLGKYKGMDSVSNEFDRIIKTLREAKKQVEELLSEEVSDGNPMGKAAR